MSKTLTVLQRALIDSLSPAAVRLFNDLMTVESYKGGAASTAAKVELDKLGLVSVQYSESDPAKDVVWFTRRGQQIANKIETNGGGFKFLPREL